MSLRSRITKVALAAGVAGALALGAPLAANASAYPVFHQVIKVKSTGHKFDIVSGPTNNTRANFKFGAASFGTYKNWKIQMVRISDKKVIYSVSGDDYLNNYISYQLENPTTSKEYTTFSSATALENVLKKGHSMTEAQLKAYAKTHVS